MAILVTTSAPSSFLSAVKAAIDAGTIATWEYDRDGDFTHTPDQWRHQAWLRPRIVEGSLVFNILAPKKTRMSKATYAIYHGRFIEMLLTHFDTLFSRATATALAHKDDLVGS